MTTTTTTRDRGDRYGPIEWAQKVKHHQLVTTKLLAWPYLLYPFREGKWEETERRQREGEKKGKEKRNERGGIWRWIEGKWREGRRNRKRM